MSNYSDMSKIGLFYGSTNGNTAQVAELIKSLFEQNNRGTEIVELYDISEYYLEDMIEFNYLILGIPTWNIGQLQSDWEKALVELCEIDLTGKQIAIFGLGDQVGYPNTFVDAIFFLGEQARMQGAELVGRWPTKGYSFEKSWAVENEQFMGLVLDEDNQPDLTQMRVKRWISQLWTEFKFPNLS